MKEEFKISLGATAVLDADNLKEGNCFFLNSRLVIVERIDRDKVFLRLAKPAERFGYYRKAQARLIVSLLIVAGLALLALIIQFFIHANK